MKKIFFVLAFLCVSLASCGKSADSSSEKIKTENTSLSSVTSVEKAENSLSDSSQEQTEQDIIDGAKDFATQFLTYMSNAEYSTAAQLCTDSFNKRHNMSEYTDGENKQEAVVQFDDSRNAVTDVLSGKVYTLGINIVPTNSSSQKISGIIMVVYKNSQYKISDYKEDTADTQQVAEKKDMTNDSRVRLLMQTANRVAAYCAPTKSHYESDDGSEFINALNDMLLEFDFYCNYSYSLTASNQAVTAVEFTNTDDGTTTKYP